MAGSTSNIGFEKQIWDAACVLRGNIDARKLDTMVTRKLRELTDEDIKKIADTYNAYVDGTLEDEKGFCAVVTTQDIAKQDYILTPGRYVGMAIACVV